MGRPIKHRTQRASEISRLFRALMRRLFVRAVSPRFGLLTFAGPAPGSRLTRKRQAEFRRNFDRYQAETRHMLTARGLLNMHRRRRTNVFLLRALYYILRVPRTVNVRLALEFGIRYLPPRWMRVQGRWRLVARREVHESLTVVANGVWRRFSERAHFDENGHFLQMPQVGTQGGRLNAAVLQRRCGNHRRNMRRMEAESTSRGDQDIIRLVPDQDEEAMSDAQVEAASHGENDAGKHSEDEAGKHGEDETAPHREDEAAFQGDDTVAQHDGDKAAPRPDEAAFHGDDEAAQHG